MKHFLKLRDQSIQTLQQEISVSQLIIALAICHNISRSPSPPPHTRAHKQNYREEAKKQRQLILALERERDRYGKDASDAQQSCITQVPL